jgi:ubiquinone/menaquinone biosynthesis C-methylase UbiE
MDKEYWDNYYKKYASNKNIQNGSSFAIFCQNKFFLKEKVILELGSGNARDAKYFALHNHNIIAIDQTNMGINIDENLIQNKLKFYQNNFVTMDYSSFGLFDVVYSRFTLHSIKEKEEDIILKKVFNSLEKQGIFAIEVRSTKDNMFRKGKIIGHNETFTDHYRRFIDSQVFLKKVINLGFKLLYFTEEDNLSIYKDDNPVLIRIILEK